MDILSLVSAAENVTNSTGYHVCNIMTGAGFDKSFFGGFAMAWLGVVIIFFLAAFARKWIGEEGGIAFSLLMALVVGYLVYLLSITFTCSTKWALVIGIAGAAVGGFLLGNVLGGSE